MLIPFEDLKSEFKRVLLSLAFSKEKADRLATVFAENSRDGVYTHGLNRFPSLVEYIKLGLVIPDAGPTQEGRFWIS